MIRHMDEVRPVFKFLQTTINRCLYAIDAHKVDAEAFFEFAAAINKRSRPTPHAFESHDAARLASLSQYEVNDGVRSMPAVHAGYVYGQVTTVRERKRLAYRCIKLFPCRT